MNINTNELRVKMLDCLKNLHSNYRLLKQKITKHMQRAYSYKRIFYPYGHVLNINTKNELCETLILPHFSCFAPINSTCLDYDSSNRIHHVQYSGIRYIFGKRKV